MNKFYQMLCIFLIDRIIHKHEKKALKKMRSENDTGSIRKRKLHDYVEDRHSYRDLLWLRSNIKGINSRWGGAFAPHWIYVGLEKYRKPFPEDRFKQIPPNEFFDTDYYDNSEEAFDVWINSYENEMKKRDK